MAGDGEALRCFVESMDITYVRWHDGTPYDLDALSLLKGDELRRAEDLLVARNLADWRDVQALDRIGSERAVAELFKGISSADFAVRGEALMRLKIRHLLSDEQIDRAVVSALRLAESAFGLYRIFDVACSHRSPAVRKQVLWTALTGPPDVRDRAAALAHFIHGRSNAVHDDAFRPLYRRFENRSLAERVEAFRELCRLIDRDADALLVEFGVDPRPPWWRFW